MAVDKRWLARVEYGEFSLPKFCDDAAALAKYLIQAREKIEPGFLGGETVYASWHLGDIEQDTYDALHHLRMAKVLVDQIDSHMVSMGGSGGVNPDDPLGEFKFSVMSLTSSHVIDEAMVLLATGGGVDWEKLVKWDRLPTLRDELDRLYSRLSDTAGERQTPIRPPVAESSRVKLYRRSDAIVATIDHHQIRSLTEAQYAGIKSLIEAGEGGLTMDSLDRASGRSDVRKVLRRLCDKNELWRAVIGFPGKSGSGGYSIF